MGRKTAPASHRRQLAKELTPRLIELVRGDLNRWPRAPLEVYRPELDTVAERSSHVPGGGGCRADREAEGDEGEGGVKAHHQLRPCCILRKPKAASPGTEPAVAQCHHEGRSRPR